MKNKMEGKLKIPVITGGNDDVLRPQITVLAIPRAVISNNSLIIGIINQNLRSENTT